MHSNRMRTTRFISRLSLSGGGGLPSGVSVTYPPVDRQTPVKILPCPKLRLLAIISRENSIPKFAFDDIYQPQIAIMQLFSCQPHRLFNNSDRFAGRNNFIYNVDYNVASRFPTCIRLKGHLL